MKIHVQTFLPCSALEKLGLTTVVKNIPLHHLKTALYTAFCTQNHRKIQVGRDFGMSPVSSCSEQRRPQS